MVRLGRSLLIVLTLLAGGGALFAASSGEKNAFESAERLFLLKLWDYAARDFVTFIEKYPRSPRVPEAVLLQAVARYNQDRFAETTALLSTNLSRAGTNEDNYLYWIAQAEARNSNPVAAAETFTRLIEKFPASGKRLPACVALAVLFAKQQDWPRVIELLQKPDGVFQQLAGSTPPNDWVTEGWLVLGEAQLARSAFADAGDTMNSLAALELKSDLNWRRSFFQCRLALAEGRPKEALVNTTNLVALASNATDRAQSVAFQAGVFEQLEQLEEAIGAYRQNLATNAPVEQQRHAMLKIGHLSLVLNRPGEAVAVLEDFLSQYPEAESADAVLLVLGELQLKQYLASATITNGAVVFPADAAPLLAEARDKLDRVLSAFTNSTLRGKALLNKGWCLWTNGQFAESEEAFQSAVRQLPVSLDQAVARFKWADAQFMRGDFAGALTNYQAVAGEYDSVPEVKEQLLELALYQAARAALTHHNLAAAEDALRQILLWFPEGSAGPRCLLLVGQGFNQQQEPARARELFSEFEQRHPDNPLLPQVRLAKARTYEQEENWPAAIDSYSNWINTCSNHAELPQAEYRRAWNCSRAGQETNALALFKSFVARFATHELASQAQWWIADYYYNRGDFQNAELNYQLVYANTNAPPSPLAFRARLMAGRAAVRSLHYQEAIDVYFTSLTGNSNCPADLRAQALFAYGDAQTNLETNRQANLVTAIAIYQEIQTNSDLWLPAQGQIGNCYLQLAATNSEYYPQASDAYQRVADSPHASFAARSQARVGLGIVAEKLAELADPGSAERAALFSQALDHYLGVFVYKKNLRDDERPDLFWVKEAGLKAGSLAERLQLWEQSYNIYQQLCEWFPTLNLEPKMLKLIKAHPELARAR